MGTPRATRRRLMWPALLLVPLLLLTVGPAPAQAVETTTRIIRVPLDIAFFLPCANGGAGEIIHLSGTITSVYHVTIGEPSGSHIQSIEVQQHVSGVGETTGDHYVSTFVNLFNYNDRFGEPPITSTQEVVFRITGPGPGNDALLRITNHSTINANGTITVAFDTFTAECLPTEP
jgi:hypothetical protein